MELIEITIPKPEDFCRVKDLEETYVTDPLDIQKGWVEFFERLVRLPRQIRETLFVMIRNSDPSVGNRSESVCLWGEVRMFAGLNEREFIEQVMILAHRGFIEVWDHGGDRAQTIDLRCFDENDNNIYTPLTENLTEIELFRLIVEREFSLMTKEAE